MTSRVLFTRLILPVAIAMCVSLSQAQTRIQETDKSIAYTGTWYTNGSSLNSGGSSALTNALGATATVSFNGTGITWIGALDPWAGFATVYLDGAMSVVDNYGSTTQYQQKLFTVQGLANGPHTLSIQVNHSRDVNGKGSWVWIDAFDIQDGSSITGGITAAAGRSEENSPALTYNGVWFPHASSLHSAGNAVLATDAGSRVTVTFSGTGITWIGYRDAASGIANVYVDGVLKTTLDTYQATTQAQSPTYSVNGLTAGVHTLSIEVTGTHNSATTESWIWVDAFDVVGGSGGGGPTGPPTATGVSPGAGGGSAGVFSFTFSDPGGPQDMAVADVLINNALDGRRACFVAFVPAGTSSGSILLVDDTGATGAPGSTATLPGSGIVSNSQCSVNAGGSSASWSGNTLTLNLQITFMSGFSGNKATYLAAQSKSSGSSGWQALGTWAVPGSAAPGPAVGGMSPARSSTLNQTYTFTFTDTNGWQDIGVADILINSALDGRHACYVAFVPSSARAGAVLLVDDAGDSGGPYQGLSLPGSGSIANSQCSIAGAGSSVSASGTTLTLTLAITFTHGAAGNQLFYLAARNAALNSDWQTAGSVTIP